MKYLYTETVLNKWDVYEDNTGTYRAEIVRFEETSPFGINKGRISKLYIKDVKTGKCLCSYDRGWDTKPEAEVKDFYNEVLEKLN